MQRISVYRSSPSNSAVRLAETLRSLGYKALKITEHDKAKGFIVCWGSSHRQGNFNSKAASFNKLEELVRLHESGIPCLAYSNAPGQGTWLGRTVDHYDGRDFDRKVRQFQYFTKFEEFKYEMRYHIFMGKSLRAGVKLQTEEDKIKLDLPLRTYAAGWRVKYGKTVEPYLNLELRHLAINAVKALKLDFGAVDIGIDAEGKGKVIEVNTAPALTPGTAKRYAEAIGKEFLRHQNACGS